MTANEQQEQKLEIGSFVGSKAIHGPHFNTLGHITHAMSAPLTSSKFTQVSFREGYGQSMKQKMQYAFSATEQCPSQQHTMIKSCFEKGVSLGRGTRLNTSKTDQFPTGKRFEYFHNHILETRIPRYPSSHINCANIEKRSKLLLPTSMKQFQSSVHNQGQPPILQNIDPAHKFKHPHKADLSHKGVLKCSQIP